MKFLGQKLKLKNNLKFNIKLSDILNTPDKGLEKILGELKKNRRFKILKASGIIKSVNFKKSFAKYPFEKFALKDNSQTDYSLLLDNENSIVSKIKSVGIDRFKNFFLESSFDAKIIAYECELTLKEVKEIKEFIEKIYVNEPFNETPAVSPVKIYNCVGKIEKVNDKFEIVFFNENIWREKYEINRDKLKLLSSKFRKNERNKFLEIIEKISAIEYKKSSLYELVNLLIKKQNKYLSTSDIKSLEKFNQKDAAFIIGCHPSVINRLVNHKSIMLPWGIEVPLVGLLSSQKAVNKTKLSEIINTDPELSDKEIAEIFLQSYGIKISRRSINQYRKELIKTTR